MEEPKKSRFSAFFRFTAAALAVSIVALGVMAFVPKAFASQVYSLQGQTDTPATPAAPAEKPFGYHGFGGFGRHGGWFGAGNSQYDSFLADALGITVDQLDAARQKADTAMIDQMLADGRITQDQADLMKARLALAATIHPDELLAKALGITVDELNTARSEDPSLSSLLDQLGITRADAQTALQNAYQAAVQQAVTDGVITQDQADQILASGTCDFPGLGGMRGPGRHGGWFGGPGENAPSTPDTTTSSGSGT